MIETFFSTQSRKAWIGGVVAAGLTPILQLVAEGGHLSIGTAVAAVATGALTALGVFQVTNEKNPADLAAEQQRIREAEEAAFAAAKAHLPGPVAQTVDHLLEEASKDFGGQTIE